MVYSKILQFCLHRRNRKNIATRNVSWPQNIPKMSLRLGLRPGPCLGSSQRSLDHIAGLGEGGEGREREETKPQTKSLDTASEIFAGWVRCLTGQLIANRIVIT